MTEEPSDASCSQGPAPLGLCEATPDAIRLPDLESVGSALANDGTDLAHGLRPHLSALSFVLAFLIARGEEEMGVVAAAKRDRLPGTVG